MNNIRPLRNITAVTYGFLIATLLLVFIIDNAVEDPLHFLMISSGVVLFGFFLKRAINQIVGA